MKKQTIRVLIPVLCVIFLLPETGAALILNDGLVHDIDYEIMDLVEVYNSPLGNPTTLNILPGASLQLQLKVYEDSFVNILGGVFENDLWFYDQSSIVIEDGNIRKHISVYGSTQVAISGGQFGENYGADSVLSRDDSLIIVSGGLFSPDTTFDMHENGEIIIQGTNFSPDYGEYKHSDFPSGGHLTGRLASGDLIDHNFSIENNGTLTILSMPEPSTMMFFVIGSLIIRRK